MRWLLFLVLWVVAIVVAVLIVRRVWRGKPIVLAGRWSPKLVRMIAVILVVLGGSDDAGPPRIEAAPGKLPIREASDELPAAIKPATVQMWLMIHNDSGPYSPGRKALVQALAGRKLTEEQKALALDHARFLGPKMNALLTADLSDQATKPTAGDLRDVLDELEKAGRYDHFWNAYLWRKTAAIDSEARVELYARLRQHSRITDALIRAHAQVKPLMQPPRAWMSKAGPKKGDVVEMEAYETAMKDMVKVAKEVLPTTDEGTWKRDGIALIKLIAGSPQLIRGGRERELPGDQSTRFGRLDLLKTGEKPASIGHEWLGKIDLPAKSVVSVWELPTLLPAAAKQKLDEVVHEALKDNSEVAADRLERCLPMSHAAIRAGLQELPNSKGAPRLRLILSLFDDTIMPVLAN